MTIIPLDKWPEVCKEMGITPERSFELLNSRNRWSLDIFYLNGEPVYPEGFDRKKYND